MLAVKVDALHRDQIHHANKAVFAANRNLQRNRIAVQSLTKLLDDTARVCAHAIHLIDECNSRHAVTSHLAIHGHALALHTTNAAQNQNSSIQNSQATFDFDGKVHVSGCIDHIDRVVVPVYAGSSRVDCDSTFAFDRIAIHRRAAVLTVDFVHRMDASTIEQHAFGKSGFARINMSRDADVAKTFKSSHVYLSLMRFDSKCAAGTLCRAAVVFALGACAVERGQMRSEKAL